MMQYVTRHGAVDLDGVPFFLPSLYGDVRLTAQGDQTEIEWENLSPSEREAVSTLGKKFNVDTAGADGKLVVPKPIAKVEAVLSKAMKRGRKLLSAVVFKNGKVEELSISELPEAPASPAVAAVTVGQPTLGCPVPEFERADVLATRVLKTFLSADQFADFDRTQSFLVTGGDTGHPYILTSRQASAERLAHVGGRSVFDLAERQAICVHDWTVPAAEELLELKLFLELPGREQYARGLPEAFG